ncbi:Hypothetical predicted protein [Lecanosticta acicola]|uniref:Uncharacterized protein n=1 Tax=Lecanosticta acicola TaxID=111012 RepID=A0AAI8Z3G0_9PEZI|nr:Hypothetical predicted protein [Lecanosticta acicola]
MQDRTERRMSWLSLRRRRTTGNLKSLPNGHQVSQEGVPAIIMPTTKDRPPPSLRPFSQPDVPRSNAENANLFYAYAQKVGSHRSVDEDLHLIRVPQGDDTSSRYSLTFASASFADDWYKLVKQHFPNTNRPAPQLFSFRTDDFLSRAWRHPAFGHLQTKWMYTTLSDTSSDSSLGGEAQRSMPVQDEQGNILGGAASPSTSADSGRTRREVKDMKDGVGRVGEHSEKMMETVERNTEGARKSAEAREEHGHYGQADGHSREHFYMRELSGHFGRMTDLLERNTEHMENLSKRQFDHEQKLQQALESMSARQSPDALDLSRFSSHLDRIQQMMEQSLQERQDSARSAREKPPSVNLSPLAEGLGKMQEAVEQNSTLMKALLEESSQQDPEAPRTPFGAPFRPQQVDLSPLDERLQGILDAIQQQNSHMQALVGFASGGQAGQSGDSPPPANTSLAPLSEHLEQIHNAIEEGNKQAREAAAKFRREKLVDFKPLTSRLDALQNTTKTNVNHFEKLLDAQKAIRQALERDRRELDFSPLAETLGHAIENQHAPLLEQLQSINSGITRNEDVFTTAITDVLGGVDLTELYSRLDALQEAVQKNSTDTTQTIDCASLKGHLEAIRETIASNAEQLTALIEAQRAHATPTDKTGPDIDLTPLTDHLNRIHTSLEKATKPDPPPGRSGSGSGDPKFVLKALTSHLSRIQSVTESNAQTVHTLLQRTPSPSPSPSTNEKLHTYIADALDSLRRTNARQKRQEGDLEGLERKVEATNSQFRELMGAQRDMNRVLRTLAEALAAQNPASCGHVVIPPPRKIGRKVVGFVYDAGGK